MLCTANTKLAAVPEASFLNLPRVFLCKGKFTLKAHCVRGKSSPPAGVLAVIKDCTNVLVLPSDVFFRLSEYSGLPFIYCDHDSTAWHDIQLSLKNTEVEMGKE